MREEREKKFGFWLLLGFQAAERERERERKKKSPRHPSPPPPPFPSTPPPHVVTVFLSPSTSRLCLDRFLSLTAQLGAIVQTCQRRDKFSIFRIFDKTHPKISCKFKDMCILRASKSTNLDVLETEKEKAVGIAARRSYGWRRNQRQRLRW
ncbi:hypothetical protein LWI29_038250 [Acer saccharum]|uniref:Uncharacterized protein n=1 Tax=Acer saccharum TaxID=4024 RepID=A0AA39SZ43_ACESA|nr:hypothetical protein LWI29_038250 [Acer saccharum]